MYFYSNFVHLCNQIGKTPSRVAEELGISKSAVSRWKSGGGVTDSLALKLADYFGVTIEQLLQQNQSNQSISASNNSVVLSGNVGDNNVNTPKQASLEELPYPFNGKALIYDLSDQEQEMLRIFRMMPMRKKHAALNSFYAIEDELIAENSKKLDDIIARSEEKKAQTQRKSDSVTRDDLER